MAEGLTIEQLRARIDRIDEQLVRLLNERVTCAVDVGRLKKDAGLAVHQPDRETQVLSGVRRSAAELAGPLTAEAVVRIFERIIDEARRAEHVGETGQDPDAREPASGLSPASGDGA